MDTLPLELKEIIIGYLDKSSVLKLSAVSKEWNALLEDLVWSNPKFTTMVPLFLNLNYQNTTFELDNKL